jgi:hypothetical protein
MVTETRDLSGRVGQRVLGGTLAPPKVKICSAQGAAWFDGARPQALRGPRRGCGSPHGTERVERRPPAVLRSRGGEGGRKERGGAGEAPPLCGARSFYQRYVRYTYAHLAW